MPYDLGRDPDPRRKDFALGPVATAQPRKAGGLSDLNLLLGSLSKDDGLRALGILDDKTFLESKRLLVSIGSMLSKLCMKK